jgi:hypothetical protein
MVLVMASSSYVLRVLLECHAWRGGSLIEL